MKFSKTSNYNDKLEAILNVSQMRVVTMHKIYQTPLFIVCVMGMHVLQVEAQSSDTVNKCTVNGQIVFQSEACPTTAPKNPPPFSKQQNRRDPEAIRAEADARRAEETRRRDEIQKGFRDPTAPAVTAIAPKAIPAAPLEGSTLTKSMAIDRMTTYTTVLGRGIGCGVSGTESASSRFGNWMDAQGLTKNYLLVAAAGIKMAAEQQRAGQSPDSCAKVRAQFATFPWP